MELMTQPDNVLDRMRYLIGVSRLTQAQFAKRIGINPTNLSKYLSGKIPVTDALLNKIVVNSGVSNAWLRDGADVPFPKRDLPETIESPAPVKASDSGMRQGVPVYDIDVTAGCLELSRMLTVDRITGYIDLPRLDPDCVIVRVNGDSMEPAIHNGGFISIRPIRNHRNIFWGRIYVVVMEDYRMVKYLRRNADPDLVTLHSANPAYDDMEVQRSDIQNLFLVEAIVHCELLS